MIALFLGGTLAMFISVLTGDYVARKRESVLHQLTFGAQSAALGFVYLAAAAGGALILLFLFVGLLRALL